VLTLQEVLDRANGQWANASFAQSRLGSDARNIQVRRPAPLAGSREGDLAYYFSREYKNDLASARPSVLVTGPKFLDTLQKGDLSLWRESAVVSCADPHLAMALLSSEFARANSTVAHLNRIQQTEIHPSAVVHPSVEMGPQVRIGAHCVIEAGVKIGAGTVIYPGVFLGPQVRMGEDCVLFPNVVLYEETVLGNRVRIHGGSVLGADGFGYAPRFQGGAPHGHQKIYHLGNVQVGDDVEIGASTTIDRGTVGPTVIESFVIIDNQVQIGHNCFIGEGAIICGSCGLAGRVRVGKYAILGGMVGVNNAVNIGDRAIVGGMSGVPGDVAADSAVMGSPHRDKKDYLRLQFLFNRMIEERNAQRTAADEKEKEK
jgi:UDP-3-O-[3-hydroxymyristoyl] glucosamine N-acyltransferase